MSRRKKWAAFGLCLLLVSALWTPRSVHATNMGMPDTSDIMAGADTDIVISNVNMDGQQAGEKVTVAFRAGTDNGNRNYKVTNITKIVPV